MTDDELAEIERIWAAASPGPWEVEEPFGGTSRISRQVMRPVLHDEDIRPCTEHVVSPGYDGTVDISEEDARAIAKAPEHIAALVAEVKRLHELYECGDCPKGMHGVCQACCTGQGPIR
jgi:hypothetical protein